MPIHLSFQIFRTKCSLTEKVFVGSLGLTLLLTILNSYHSTLSVFATILVYGILVTTLLLLFYIAYVDFKTMEIDNWLSLSIMVFLLSINLILYFSGYKESAISINSNFSYQPYENFYLALFLGLIFLLIVLFTKEKALGGGDIRIAIIVGLLIGRSNAQLWLYITVFSALLYGLILGFKKKKFKKLKIPFAPFMILGGILALLIDMYF